MTQAEERLPLQTTDTAGKYLFHEIRKFTNLLPGKSDEAAKRFLTIAMQVLSQKPDLLRKCGRVSVLNCLIECARLRLDPEGALGHAYLIPYKNQCTVQIGYKGFCQLVFRQGIQKVWSEAVYPEDEFTIIVGDAPRIHHKPHILPGDDRETYLDGIVGAYACIVLPSGQTDFEWMNLFSIKKTRGKSSAWVDWPIEMAKIRPLKRLLKRQKTTDNTLPAGMALDDRDGVPRDPKLELEGGAIDVRGVYATVDGEPVKVTVEKTGKDLIPDAIQDALAPSSHLVQEKVYLEDLPSGTELKPFLSDVAGVKKKGDVTSGESRKDINARIEKNWHDFHKTKIPDDALDMDRELNDYTNLERTTDAEAWKFADQLARALLVAGAQAR